MNQRLDMHRFAKSLVWFRRDLRDFDHAALHAALSESGTVYCAFVFDKEIIDSLPRGDRRVAFIHAAVTELDVALRTAGGGLIVRHARAVHDIPRLAAELGVDAVFANHDYEPAAMARDTAVARQLHADGRSWLSFKDQVIFERDDILSQSGKPFSVFTPYKNAWLKTLHATEETSLTPHAVAPAQGQLALSAHTGSIPALSDLGFEDIPIPVPAGMSGGQTLFDEFISRLAQYDRTRDFPAIKGPSYLSAHLRFGTVSIRGLVRHALVAMRAGESGAATWLGELIWRDFYFMILHHHPRVVSRAFKPEYDVIGWETGPQAESLFRSWCEGRTGYPLVDAAMLQLNQTGYMHNRLRMITASFLVKDLGIDWRYGERYFAEKLTDYDLAANNGGWQWAASTGCDAQPYFRIFNPITQSEKFDPEGKFIKRYLPALAGLSAKTVHAPWLSSTKDLLLAGITLGKDYPLPIVQHDEARKRTLERFAVVKKSKAAQPDED
jgi:deoxyribodipyrimidine photo-lyase